MSELTPYEQVKRWRNKAKNRNYPAKYMKEQRRKYRVLYLDGRIKYDDIPVAYRYFKR